MSERWEPLKQPNHSTILPPKGKSDISSILVHSELSFLWLNHTRFVTWFLLKLFSKEGPHMQWRVCSDCLVYRCPVPICLSLSFFSVIYLPRTLGLPSCRASQAGHPGVTAPVPLSWPVSLVNCISLGCLSIQSCTALVRLYDALAGDSRCLHPSVHGGISERWWQKPMPLRRRVCSLAVGYWGGQLERMDG